MSGKIQRLDEATINQIAAGEVIENPASVVKELIENSLDAKAARIEITTKAGGRSLISISDNGFGMTQGEALMALERHATSKIRTAQDLNTLNTMGFRGEALPSIAAISQMTLTTATNENEAVCIQIEGGNIISTSPAFRKKGTTIEIRSLFYNVPARKKFQKSISRDTAEIHHTLILIGIANPEVSFRWTHDEAIIFDLKATSLIERLGSLLGDKLPKNPIELENEKDSFALNGFIALPDIHFSNRTNQFLFINRRPVFSPLISKAVKEGYGPRLPTHRYPFFVFHINIAMADVDVNVHPQKREVRFSEEEKLYRFVFETIEKGLQSKKKAIGKESFIKAESYDNVGPTITYSKNFESPFETYKVSENREPHDQWSEQTKIPSVAPLLFPPSNLVLALFEGYALVSGKLLNTLDLNFEEGLYFVDLLRAIRRVEFEQWSKKDSKSLQTQQLLFPIALKLSSQETVILEKELENLNSLGFSIRPFGMNSFLVDGVPAFLEHETIKNVIEDLIQGSSSASTSPMNQSLKLIKYLKNTIENPEQASLLICKLLNCQERLYCPLGQKIFSLITTEELRKRF